MSDPQDLLYTNKFISTDILTDNQLIKETEYYDRFKNYIDNNLTDEINNYVKNDEYETSAVNIDKTLNTKWPIYSNKNHYPLFDTYTNDISTNRYKKEIITKVNVDSRYRDISSYNNNNNFTIQLEKVFNNVKKIVINDIVISNLSQSITNINNNLSWQYASKNYLIQQNIDITIIPTPSLTKLIAYSSLPNAVYEYSGNTINIEQYLVYQAQIPPGNYTVENLILTIRVYAGSIQHGLYYKPSIGVLEQPYLAYPKRIGTSHLFKTFIDPVTNIVKFVNRIEEVRIAAIQTFSPYEVQFNNVDIFYYFSSQYNPLSPYILSTKYIYIIVPATNDLTYQYYQNVNCIYTPNPFPLVITDINIPIGNIPFGLINFTEFYDIQIYLQNGYTEDELSSVSYYKFIDTITFRNTLPTIGDGKINIEFTYIRFGLHLSSGNYGGSNYNSKGSSVVPGNTSNLVFSTGLNKILNSYDNANSLSLIIGTGSTIIDNNTYTSGVITDYQYLEEGYFIGRALLFRWIFDVKSTEYLNYEFNADNEKKRSLLHILAWPIANETDQLITLENNSGFRFVHTNYQSQVIDKVKLNTLQGISNIYFPNYTLNLQYEGGHYFFVNNNYIYLKIYFDSHPNLEDDTQYINTVSAQSLLYNQVYINSNFFNVGIGQDYTCLPNGAFLTTYKKDQSYIFTKILLSDIPGNNDTKLSNIINNNSFYIYYDNIRDNIEYVTVELYDADMKQLFIDNSFSFTLNIHEIKDVLKETLINSKNNNVTTTGHFI